MKDCFEEGLIKIQTLLSRDVRTYEELFATLNRVFSVKEGLVYFLNSEKLRLEYSYNTDNVKKEILITKAEKESLFDSLIPANKVEIESLKDFEHLDKLKIKNSVYGIIAINSDKPFNKNEKLLYDTCLLAISNIIKEIELAKIMQMQTESLQKGLIDLDKAYKVIKLQNKKIISADKIKNKFLSNVSHELRTPLNSIIGFSELLQNPALGKLNEKQSEYVKDIQTAGVHLLGMINEILDISKIESHSMKLNLRDVNLECCIFETLNILMPLYKRKNIQILTQTDNITITADYSKLQQILFNIINNAIKYTPQNGTINITLTKKRKNIEIRIKDNGCGIEKKYHKKIFKKFEQINPQENSTGLGLTITKDLIKMHKGKINLISEKNMGAEFIITLPISYI